MQNITKEYQKKRGIEKKGGSYAGNTRSPVIKKISRKYIGKKVLDVGAANGSLVNLIPNAIGIDIAPKHPGVKEGDISNMNFKSESFDTVFCLEVLEHLDDKTLNKGLREVNRILKKGGGYFIITTPYKEALEENIVLCPKCETWFHKIGHVRSFDENNMTHYLRINGFEIVELKLLPLGSFARHPRLKLFWKLFSFLNLGFKANVMFVVSRKIT